MNAQFFAISLPKATDADPAERIEQSIFKDRHEALRLLKQYKGARFKAFSSLEEANLFVAQSPGSTGSGGGGEDPVGGAEPSVAGEKPSPFRTPKPQELVQLRHVIEGGEADRFRQLIWSNPRYLVSSGDTPTILQEGFRYNGLHVASKADKPELAKLLLEAVKDAAFMKLLYPDDSKSSQEQRIKFVVDLYLNTPDKGLCETPLHFASKFGAISVVKLLTSYPTCEREIKNKYGQTPLDVACSRAESSNSKIKNEIKFYLQEQFFIPILRTDDDSSPPVVGEPWSPQKRLVHPKLAEKAYSISAYAGPMTPDQAAEFHKKLKMTPRHFKNNGTPKVDSDDVRLSDYEKGLERVGRQVAAKMKVQWQEWWCVLDTFSDLSQPEGLDLLEKHLQRHWNELQTKDTGHVSDDSFVTASCVVDDEFLDASSASSGLTSLCNAFQHCHLDDEDASWLSSPSCGSPEIFETIASHRNRGTAEDPEDAVQHFLDRTCGIIADQIGADVIKLSFDASCSLKRLKEPFLRQSKWLRDVVVDMAKCGLPEDFQLQRVHSQVVSKIADGIKNEDCEVACLKKLQTVLHGGRGDWSDSSDDEESETRYRDAPAPKKCLFPSAVQQHADCLIHLLQSHLTDPDRKDASCECYWSVEDENEPETGSSNDASNDSLAECDRLDDRSTSSSGGYVTPPSTFSDLSTDVDGDAVFITGTAPTRTDLDVLRAIKDIDVDPDEFPRVYRWKRLVESFPKRLAENWPSPGNGKLRQKERDSRRTSPGHWSHYNHATGSPSFGF